MTSHSGLSSSSAKTAASRLHGAKGFAFKIRRHPHKTKSNQTSAFLAEQKAKRRAAQRRKRAQRQHMTRIRRA